jgi:murein DD-endopeptidase MepM/ murein hydrolase activator NlpD
MRRGILGLLIVFLARSAAAHDMVFQAPVDLAAIKENCYRFGVDVYSPKRKLWLKHAGRDYCADEGTSVYSAGLGLVVFAQQGDNNGFGNTVIIRHELDRQNGSSNYIYTQYSHLHSITAPEGSWVAPGQEIGTVGMTGTGSHQINHLHFEVKVFPVLEAPDPNHLSTTKEYGYTLEDPAEMGYLNPDGFLSNPRWRSIHVHAADATPGSGNLYVAGEFGSSGQLVVQWGAGSSGTLGNAHWMPARIDFDLFNAGQGGLGLAASDLPVSLLISPMGAPAFGGISFPFRDVDRDQWYARAVIAAWKRGYVNGEFGLFVPARSGSFAEFFKLLVEASTGLDPVACQEGERPMPTFPASEFPPFTAQNGSPWYCKYYKAIAQKGWMDTFLAIASGRGRPAQSILRQEVAFFLAQALPSGEDGEGADFYDVGADNPFHSEIRRCAAQDVIHGYPDGSFKPALEINRAELVNVLERALYPND